MLTKEEQTEIIGIFHDGIVTNIDSKGGDISFTVEIEYLAELVKPGNKVFQALFKDIDSFYFSNDGEQLKDFTIINRFELEILNSRIENDEIKVFCQGNNGVFGCICFSAKNIEIYDEEGLQISLDKLKDICKKYWDAFHG